MRLVACDLDGSLVGQSAVARRLDAGQAELIPLRSRAADLRLWTTEAAFRRFAALWRSVKPARGTPVVLYGSGDFHHLANAFIAEAEGPLTVLHFDNHPDWSWSMPRRHCGAWVRAALELPHVRRVVTVGPCSGDLDHPDTSALTVAMLIDGGLVLVPWRRAETVVSRRFVSARSASFEARAGRLRWREAATRDWDEVVDDLVDLVTTERVWISIDKDVLGPEDAVTNWDQGGLPLAKLITALRRVAMERHVAGVDICGEYAPAAHNNPLKAFEARLDQPAPAGVPDLAVNDRTNEALLAALEDVL
jgi:arginase family enzyme